MKAKDNNVALIIEPAETALYISADEQQLEQALINIMKNAIESIGYNGIVKLKIDAVNRQLIITDTGSGITAAQSELIFTPFYSTKKDGQGIGLTLVREILINHGFKFLLKTVSARQTEFKIWF